MRALVFGRRTMEYKNFAGVKLCVDNILQGCPFTLSEGTPNIRIHIQVIE